MEKTLVILAFSYLIFTVVSGNTNETEGNSTDARNDYECTSEITTTIKLPMFIRIFGKKPLRFIKKSISRILGKNFTVKKTSLNENYSAFEDRKIVKQEKSFSFSPTNFSTKNEKNDVTSEEKHIRLNNIEKQTLRSDSWGRKSHAKEMSYYRKFVYTPNRYVQSFKVRKYYTPGGSPSTQEATSQQTNDKVFKNVHSTNSKNSDLNLNKDIRIFTTKVLFSKRNNVNTFNKRIASQSDYDSHSGKRQRRCSVHDSSELDEGYTYLLRKKRPESTFNPYAYLTKLSKRPIFTGNYTPRRFTSFTKSYTSDRNKNIRTSLSTSAPRTKLPVSTKVLSVATMKTFIREMPELMTTLTTPRTTFRTTLKRWPRTFYTSMPQIATTILAVNESTTSAGNLTTPSTPRKHYWINNWNLPYMSYYMSPIQHTYRTYQPALTTFNPSSQSKTTRAMYYLTQYWNKGYFSYYTNFDPSGESLHDFIKRLGYLPDATTRFTKIRMMPKRYRPEGFIDVFSLDSFLRGVHERIANNQTFPPPHERDSISASVEDVSYWFFFNRSVTPVHLIPGTPWKMKPRPTMRPIPSYFFKDSIVTRYYPPSREENLEKVETTFKKSQRTLYTSKTTRSFISHTSTTPSSATHTFAPASSKKFHHITPIPTFPTVRETTAHNIDPYGLLNKIIQYNVQLKKPLSRNGSRDVQLQLSKLHPVNQLPRILQLPYTLSPKLMMYTDYRGKQLFTLLGKYHVHENNKTLECVRNPSEFLNPFKVVAPPPESGFYRIIRRHRIRENNEIEKKLALRSFDMFDGQNKSFQTDKTVAVEIRFYPIQTAKIKTWKEYLELQKQNQPSFASLPTQPMPIHTRKRLTN